MLQACDHIGDFLGGLLCTAGQGTYFICDHGILIKDVDTLQKAHAIKALIFDKTGTLTQGRPVLANWSGTDEQLRLAAALQQASEHPLALAMREAVGKEVVLPQPEAVEVRVGAGILGQVAGHRVAIGNASLLAQFGIEPPQQDEAPADGATRVWVAIDGVAVAIAALADTLRRWHQRFIQQRSKVQAQGFDARFQRTWEFYLAYCEAGFDARSIDVVQYTLIKDGERPASSGTLL